MASRLTSGLAVLLGLLMAALLWAQAALADRAAQFDVLMDALRMTDTVAIMHDEGVQYGATLIQDMMMDADTPGWRLRVGLIYDEARMYDLLTSGLEAELAQTDLDPLVAFFTSELGAEIIALELAAREAFFDEEVEMAARDRFEDLTDNDDPLIAQITTMMEDSDLVEFNVMGIMNANLMLYRGLADGGAIDLGEEDILRDVWTQEGSVRSESTGWIQGYFLTAYGALPEQDLEAYAAFWRTDEGRAFNAALFAVFDQMYEELSYLLGRATAEQLQSEEL
ncbi:MAG: DUF2059 domain-containing protein [Pseudomonadota bacterium]